ncbi:phage head closure protein [Neoaquamicrobium sediminum]|uniref:Head-tail adaptor protein n=2 Tax=root TaxID=1 RepID=A0AB38ZLI3_9VIRU
MARYQPDAGALRDRVAFDKRGTVDDGMGNSVAGPFEEQFSVRAELRALRGSEAVIAGRLEGRNTFGVYVRPSIKTRLITSDWRMRDTRRGTVYAIRTVDAVTDPLWIYLTVESGVAA